jgi:hypothetical protein
MATLGQNIIELLTSSPGLSDREITDKLLGRDAPQQGVNQTCRSLESRGRLIRKVRPDGRIGNFVGQQEVVPQLPRQITIEACDNDTLSEDEVKKILEDHLTAKGWHARIAWGQIRGADIEATRGSERWIIEVKGCGSLQPMRVNYFLSILGEILQRMNDEGSKYSIALPDMKQFRGLWDRLPTIAKRRTRISAIFVESSGSVTEVN